MRLNNSNETEEVYIGPSLILKGVINSTYRININGTVDGEAHAPDVIIGHSGHINGSVIADRINVHGTICNDIKANKELIIHAQAVVNAKVIYRKIQVIKGGRINGEMKKLSE